MLTGWIAARSHGMMGVAPLRHAMIQLDRIGLYLPLPTAAWTELAAKVRALLPRLPTWGIRVGPVSDQWRRQHEQESGKR